MKERKNDFWKSPLKASVIKSEDVRLPEMLIGYFIDPFCALLASGIFTSILQNYFTDVLKLDLTFLTTLQLLSTILIVAANLLVGQLIERTRALAGKARPWILLSALTISVGSVLIFIVPFKGTARMVWIAVAYNLYYAIALPPSRLQYSEFHAHPCIHPEQQTAVHSGFHDQCGRSWSHGCGVHALSHAGLLCTYGKPGPVVCGHAGSRDLLRSDHLSSVQIYQRACHGRTDD